MCGEEFQSLVKYGYHKAEMHGLMRPYDCLLCSDEFCTRHELFVHLHNHIGILSTLTESTILFWKHFSFVFFADVTGSYTCDLCGIKFSIKATYEQHKKSHTKGSDQSNVSNEQVDGDKTVDHDRKFSDYSTTETNSSKKILNKQVIPCKADGCDETFTTQKQLRTHMAIHKLATYNCPKCKRKYHSKTVYETHVRLCMPRCDDVVLIADEEIDSGPVVCSTCSQLFENKKVLKFHQKICNDNNDDQNMGDRILSQEIEEIYLKTEVEEELENLVPEL